MKYDDASMFAAYHEAAHAVLASRAGFAIRYITIRPKTPGLGGRLMLDRRELELRQRWCDFDRCEFVRMLLAGAVAERRLGQKRPGDGPDLKAARRMIRDLAAEEAQLPPLLDSVNAGSPVQALCKGVDRRYVRRRQQLARDLMRVLRLETEALVARHWDEIHVVATELLAQRTLTGEQVRRILAGMDFDECGWMLLL